MYDTHYGVDSGSLLKAVMGPVEVLIHLVDGFLMENHATSSILQYIFISQQRY